MSSRMDFSYDDETGEIITYNVNEETGEQVENNSAAFHACSPTREANDTHERCKNCNFVQEKEQNIKAQSFDGSNIGIFRMILLLTIVVFFPGVTTILLIILEIFLHVQCHKKNKYMKNSTLYYRSPLHVVTSIFCGVCRDCDTASKIGQLQDKRKYRHNNVIKYENILF